MKRLLLALSITLFALPALGADMLRVPGFVPMPKPNPERVALSAYAADKIPAAELFAQAVNPDPFNTQRHAQAPATPAQTQAPGQIVTVPTPVIDTTPGILSWILTAIGGAGVGGIWANIFRKPQAPKVDPSTVIQSPEFQDVIERVLARAVNSDTIRAAARTGIGFIPGVGGFATPIEEVVNRAVKAALEAKLGAGAVTRTVPTTASEATLDQRLDHLESIVGDLAQIVKERIKPQGATS